MDDVDRALLARLQDDSTQTYATLGQAVGLSAGSVHERVRKLRERGVIRRTTVEIDPAAVGRPVLAFVMLDGSVWMGDAHTRQSLEAIPEIEEAHIIAGSSSVILKIRTASTMGVQAVLRRLFEVEGVTATRTIIVLETAFERPIQFGTA